MSYDIYDINDIYPSDPKNRANWDIDGVLMQWPVRTSFNEFFSEYSFDPEEGAEESAEDGRNRT